MGRVLGRPRIWLAAFVVMVALAVILWKRVPTGFIPTEDKGYFAIAMQLPDASSLQRTRAVIQRVEGFLHEEPAVVNVVAFAGLDVLTRTNQTNSATIFILLKPWDERGEDESIDAITKRINGKLFGMKDAVGFAFNLPEIPGLGATSGVEVNLQNRSGKDVRDFAQKVQAFQAAVNQLPAVQAHDHQLPGQRAPGVSRRRPGHRQVARGEPHRTVQHAADVPLHAVHQRLQPLRPDLPGAGGGAAAVPPRTRRTSHGCTSAAAIRR